MRAINFSWMQTKLTFPVTEVYHIIPHRSVSRDAPGERTNERTCVSASSSSSSSCHLSPDPGRAAAARSNKEPRAGMAAAAAAAPGLAFAQTKNQAWLPRRFFSLSLSLFRVFLFFFLGRQLNGKKVVTNSA